MRSVLLCLMLVVATVNARPQAFFGFHPQAPPLIPPGFREHLPEEAKEKLLALHFDKDLDFQQRRDKIEEVFDELPREVLEKLPLPPGLERLPEESKSKFRELHLDRSLGWRKRQELVRKAISQLPEDEQRLVAPPKPANQLGQGFQPGSNPLDRGSVPPPPPSDSEGFPSSPPPGFETVLAPTIYRQLLAVHEDPSLSVEEKKHTIDRIMKSVPQDQLNNLPLPPSFERLPMGAQQRLRAIMHDFSVDWETRHNRVRDFIHSLPREERRLVRPPSPPGFEALPDETQDQIDDLFFDEKLSQQERFAKVHEIVQKLPAELRANLPPPPPFMPQFADKQQEDAEVEDAKNEQQ